MIDLYSTLAENFISNQGAAPAYSTTNSFSLTGARQPWKMFCGLGQRGRRRLIRNVCWLSQIRRCSDQIIS